MYKSCENCMNCRVSLKINPVSGKQVREGTEPEQNFSDPLRIKKVFCSKMKWTTAYSTLSVLSLIGERYGRECDAYESESDSVD